MKQEEANVSEQLIHDAERMRLHIFSLESELAACRESLEESRDWRSCLSAVLRTVREPLAILDHAYRIIAGSGDFFALSGAAPDEAAGISLFELGGGRWDVAALRAAIEDVVREGNDARDVRVLRREQDGTGRVFLINAARTGQPGGELTVIAFRETGSTG